MATAERRPLGLTYHEPPRKTLNLHEPGGAAIKPRSLIAMQAGRAPINHNTMITNIQTGPRFGRKVYDC